MDRLCTGIQMNLYPFLFQHLFHAVRYILVVAGHEPVASFEKGNFAPELGIHRSKFQSDISSAHDNQVLRQHVPVQKSSAGIYFLTLLNPVYCRNNRCGTRIDEDFFPLQFDIPFRQRHLDDISRNERTFSRVDRYIGTFA